MTRSILLVLLLACSPARMNDAVGSAGADRLDMSGGIALAPGTPVHVLAGTTLCPRVFVEAETCLESEVAGAVTEAGEPDPDTGADVVDPECVTVDGAGEGTWTLASPADCEDPPRVIELVGVAVDEVSWTLVAPSQRGHTGATDAGLPERASTVLILADTPVFLHLEPRTDDGRLVSFDPDQVQLELSSGDGEVRGERARVRVPAGDVQVEVWVGDHRASATALEGVREDALVSLEIAAPIARRASPRIDADLPALDFVDRVEAVHRTADGQPVFGVPTRVRGRAGDPVVFRGAADDDPAPRLQDVCLPPSDRTGDRRVGVRAVSDVSGLSTSTAVRWTVDPTAMQALVDAGALPSEVDFEAAPECPQVVGCSASSTPGGIGVLWLPLLGLLVRRRTRG